MGAAKKCRIQNHCAITLRASYWKRELRRRQPIAARMSRSRALKSLECLQISQRARSTCAAPATSRGACEQDAIMVGAAARRREIAKIGPRASGRPSATQASSQRGACGGRAPDGIKSKTLGPTFNAKSRGLGKLKWR
jgi:hypothetical protein